MSGREAAWDTVAKLSGQLRSAADAGDWGAVDQARHRLHGALTSLLSAAGRPADSVALAQCLEVVRDATRQAAEARASVARRLLEVRAGGRAVAAYSGHDAALRRRV